MAYVNSLTGERSKLTSKQWEFFEKIVPLAGFIQQQTYNKALVTGKMTVYGVRSSVLLAHMLVASRFGEHPVSQTSYESQAANNLALLEAHAFWKKAVLIYDGHRYRGYKNWREFAIDWSDTVAWQDGHEKLLREKSVFKQIEVLSEHVKIVSYYDMMLKHVEAYNLQEFDSCLKRV